MKKQQSRNGAAAFNTAPGEPDSVVTLAAVPCSFSDQWQTVAADAIEAGADVVYADHGTTAGVPLFKPDYSPSLPASAWLPFVGVRRRHLAVLGDEFDGQDMSAVIDALCRRAGGVTHIPGIMADVDAELLPAARKPPVLPPSARISIIIPTRDQLALLQACIESVRRTPLGGEAEIVVVDNGSREPATREWLELEADRGRINRLLCDEPFNWSRLNNAGARVASGDVLVFLNNDVEVISGDWLARLAGFACEPDAGAVGPLLLYADGRIQHAGVVIGFGGYADHVYAGSTLEEAGGSCFISPECTREVAAVTGACLVTRRAAFETIGGFDEQFTVAGDVAYCLRLVAAGYRNVFDGASRLYHYESQTRQAGLPESDRDALAALIQATLPDGDPWYSPNLSLHSRFPLVDLV